MIHFHILPDETLLDSIGRSYLMSVPGTRTGTVCQPPRFKVCVSSQSQRITPVVTYARLGRYPKDSQDNITVR